MPSAGDASLGDQPPEHGSDGAKNARVLVQEPIEAKTTMRDEDCVAFLQWALPQLRLRWAGFGKVRRQVCQRLLRRLEELGLVTLDQYRDHLMRDRAEWTVLDGLCHITISAFYRDRHVLDALAARVLQEIAKTARQEGRAARCWCAGCASGEEVYTLRILWDLRVEPQVPGSQLEVVGTDADEVVLRRAERGCFSLDQDRLTLNQ